MDRYWENGSGIYDPVAKEAIEKEKTINQKMRNKEIHDTINQIKNILGSKNLKLLNRMELKDELSGKIYK